MRFLFVFHGACHFTSCLERFIWVPTLPETGSKLAIRYVLSTCLSNQTEVVVVLVVELTVMTQTPDSIYAEEVAGNRISSLLLLLFVCP